MKTEIAQMVSLTSYGNMFLKNKPIPLDLNHSTMNFCRKIEFVEVLDSEDSDEEKKIAKSPMEWFEYLKIYGIQQLKLHIIPETINRMDTPFANGGGRWIIEALEKDISNIWDVRWETSSYGGTNRIWTVTYGLTAKNTDIPQINYPPVDVWHENLESEITILRNFAKEHSLYFAVNYFQDALYLLNSSEPFSNIGHPDLIPPDIYSLKCKQIFAASQKAWIIATIDWIETDFEDDDVSATKIEISDELFDTLCKAIMVATNSITFSKE